MKVNIKTATFLCLILVLLAFVTGCAAEKTPYENNDADNYNVSVKFDANGGIFTTNTSVIVDSFNISAMQTGSDGKVQIALLSPDNAYRGNDAFTAVNNGYFLAGWYAQRTETLDEQGNPAVVYGDRWNFEEDLLAVDPNGQYSASQPVLTLYAAWVPMFEIEFYSLDTGEYLDRYTFDPTTEEQLLVPQWSQETGTIQMHHFPKRSGYTFQGVYYDAEGLWPVQTDAVEHPGVVDYTNGMAKDPVLKLYVDWKEGEWYRIYNTEQFLDNASVSGCYEIYADLDFTDVIWPSSLMYGNFSGAIQGNGHVFRNITAEQTNNSKVNAGLFGHLTENARITDLTFEDVTFTLKAGTRIAGATFGLLSGTVSGGAVLENVAILDSVLQIDASCYFGTDDYAIGLVCGMGNASVDHSGISCKVVGEQPETVTVTVTDGVVTLTFPQ